MLLDPARPAGQVRDPLTEEDYRPLLQCIDAEARADVDAAIEHYLAGVYVENSPQLRDLRVLQALGDDVPPWVWSRWTLRQAHRWLVVHQDARLQTAAAHTVAAIAPDLDALPSKDPVAMSEIFTALAVVNWVTVQLLLYEFGGLRDFLRDQAQPALLAKGDDMRDWADAPLRAHRLMEVRDDAISWVDLRDGERVDVLNIGAAADLARGSTVLGRRVPISAAPGLMFESRPLEVDEETARMVADVGSADWGAAIHDGVTAGRLRTWLGTGQPTPLMSDIEPTLDARR